VLSGAYFRCQRSLALSFLSMERPALMNAFLLLLPAALADYLSFRIFLGPDCTSPEYMGQVSPSVSCSPDGNGGYSQFTCSSPSSGSWQSFTDAACARPTGSPSPTSLPTGCVAQGAPGDVPAYMVSACVTGNFTAPTSGLVFGQYPGTDCRGPPVPTTHYPNVNACLDSGSMSARVSCNATAFAVSVYAENGCPPRTIISNRTWSGPTGCSRPQWSNQTSVNVSCYAASGDGAPPVATPIV
jgi:hypothetical protein